MLGPWVSSSWVLQIYNRNQRYGAYFVDGRWLTASFHNRNFDFGQNRKPIPLGCAWEGVFLEGGEEGFLQYFSYIDRVEG